MKLRLANTIYLFSHIDIIYTKHNKISTSSYHIKHTWHHTSCFKVNYFIMETNNQIREKNNNQARLYKRSLKLEALAQAIERFLLKLGVAWVRALIVSIVRFCGETFSLERDYSSLKTEARRLSDNSSRT